MSFPTFYIPPDQISGDRAVMSGDELRHARLTLRLGAGDTVKVIDGKGSSWEGLIQSMGKEESVLRLERKKVEPEAGFRLSIAMGIVPGDRYDWAVQKGTELGAVAFLPLVTERTEVKFRGKWKRIPRLERIIASSCKQCGRARFPAISDPVQLGELDTGHYDLCLVFWEEETASSMKVVAEGIKKSPGSCLMIIGPVGGLTPGEVELLKEKGCLVAGMGPRILRTETAVAAGAAILQHLWGDMN